MSQYCSCCSCCCYQTNKLVAKLFLHTATPAGDKSRRFLKVTLPFAAGPLYTLAGEACFIGTCSDSPH